MLPKNTVPITNKQPIKFKCSACGACCKNVKDSIILEPLDAFRIIAEKKKNGCTDSEEDILLDIAELKELSPCFSVFVLSPPVLSVTGMCHIPVTDRNAANQPMTHTGRAVRTSTRECCFRKTVADPVRIAATAANRFCRHPTPSA